MAQSKSMETTESVPRAIRRLAQAAWTSALRRLGDTDVPLAEQIHEARKAIKKVRALTRLVRPAIKRARHENGKLRSIARALSSLRDAHVQYRTFQDLTRGYAGAADSSVGQLTTFFAEGVDTATRAFEGDDGTKRLRRRLRKARRRVDRWLPTDAPDDRWPAIGQGFVRGYERAQRAMAKAFKHKSDAAFHAWRRGLKFHRHHVQALLNFFPEDFESRLRELETLDEILGNEHDLSTLKETLTRMESRVRWNQRCTGLLKMLNERRARLRSQARALGDRLFARSVKSLRRQLKTRLQEPA